ncbi:hypothetical protein I4U23_020389 [Adineta vaga]|nr:hypothetical protein I4U23_020389 [Adineta vaga]
MTANNNLNCYVVENISIVAQNASQFSQEELLCRGRACIRCHKCRDWYWTPDYSSCSDGDKFYMKRPDATCNACTGGSRQCECNDNQFRYANVSVR